MAARVIARAPASLATARNVTLESPTLHHVAAAALAHVRAAVPCTRMQTHQPPMSQAPGRYVLLMMAALAYSCSKGLHEHANAYPRVLKFSQNLSLGGRMDW